MRRFIISIIAVVLITAGLRANTWTDWVAVKKASQSEILIVSYYYFDYKEDADDLLMYEGKFSVMIQGLQKYLVTFKSPDGLKGVKVLYIDGKVWEYIPKLNEVFQIAESCWGKKIGGEKFAPPFSFAHMPDMDSFNEDFMSLRDKCFWMQIYMICNPNVNDIPSGKQKLAIELTGTQERYEFTIENKLVNVTLDNDPFDPAKLAQN